jgi:hypothetical protein
MAEIDWDRPQGTRGSGQCYVNGCGEDAFAHVHIGVRLREKSSGVGRQMASRQHVFCKAHAEEVYGGLFEEVERRDR